MLLRVVEVVTQSLKPVQQLQTFLRTYEYIIYKNYSPKWRWLVVDISWLDYDYDYYCYYYYS